MRKYLFVVLLLSQLCLAERPWEKKPIAKWSAKEVNQLMNDSPWAKTVNLATTSMSLIGNGPGSPQGRGRSAAAPAEMYETLPQISYQVQLRSALPMRQAVARKSQLDANYDSMPPERRSALDGKINDYLSQRFDDVVVVQVAYTSNVPSYFSDVRRHWRAQTVETVKGSLFLNVAGKKYEAITFLSGEGIFQVTFERSKDLASNSNFSLEFQNPQTGVIAEQRVLVQFSPKEMAFDGAIAF